MFGTSWRGRASFTSLRAASKTARTRGEIVRSMSKLGSTASFVQFASRTLFNAGQRYGAPSRERKAVIAAWKEVGVAMP